MNNISHYLSSAYNATTRAGLLETQHATVAVPKFEAVEDLRLSHELHPCGVSVVESGDTQALLAMHRKLMAGVCLPGDQLTLAGHFRSATVVKRVISSHFGVQNSPAARIPRHSIRVDRDSCIKMAELLCGRSAPSAMKSLAAAVWASLFAELKWYEDSRSVKHLVRPLPLENQLFDPFSTAVELYTIKRSPFAEIDYSDTYRRAVHGGQDSRHVAFMDIVNFITHSMSSVIMHYQDVESVVNNAMVGLHLIAKCIHGELDIPAVFDDPITSTLRQCITFHHLTTQSGGGTTLWASSGNQKVQEIKAAIATLSRENISDTDTLDQAVLTKKDIDIKASLMALTAVLNEFIDFVPVTRFQNYFGWANDITSNDSDTVAAVSLHIRSEAVSQLEAYTGLVLDESYGDQKLELATLSTKVGTIPIPTIQERVVSDGFSSIATSLTKVEASRLVAMIAGEEDGEGGAKVAANNALTLLPGCSVPLVTNVIGMEHASTVNFSAELNMNVDGDIEVPYLVYLAAASLATSFIFEPNSPVRFVKRPEPGTQLILCNSQISRNTILDRDMCETANPCELLVVTPLADTNPKEAITVKDPTVDMSALISNEFLNPVEKNGKFQPGANASSPVINIVVPRIPGDANGRRNIISQLGALKRKYQDDIPDKALTDAGLTRDMLEIPILQYKKRNNLTADNRDQWVIAPIDLSNYFAGRTSVFVSYVRSMKSLDKAINDQLDGAAALMALSAYGKEPARQVQVDLLREFVGPYLNPSLRRTDISGLSQNTSAQELREFLVHMALATSTEMLVRCQLIESTTRDRLVGLLTSVDDAVWTKLTNGMLPRLAKDMGL